VRDELNKNAPRRLAVLEPLLLKIVNFKELGISKTAKVQNHPTNAEMGEREVSLSDTIFIGEFFF